MPIVPAREGGNFVVPRPAVRSLHEKPPRKRGFSHAEGAHALFLEPDARELLLEPREPPAAIHQLLLTAGPGRMRLGVDVEVHGVAFLAPGAAGGEFSTVGHHHLDGVIVRMQVEFHASSSCARCARGSKSRKSRGSIPQAAGGNKSQPKRRACRPRRLLPAARRGIVAPLWPLSVEVAKGSLR